MSTLPRSPFCPSAPLGLPMQNCGAQHWPSQWNLRGRNNTPAAVKTAQVFENNILNPRR
jgi:hypothetical protein